MRNFILYISVTCLFSITTIAQTGKTSIPLKQNKDLASFNVIATDETYGGKESLKVIATGENTEVEFVKVSNLNFKNGTIEIDVAGKPAEGSSEQARDFV